MRLSKVQQIVEQKARIGDWEGDTVISAVSKTAISVFVKKVVASNKLKLPHPLRYFATYISVLFPQKTGNRPKIQAIKTSRIVA